MDWGHCLRGPKVSFEVAAVAAATDLMAETGAAAVQIDADAAVPHC